MGRQVVDPRCIACGMPMGSAADHAGGDDSRDYCIHCARPDGSMQCYEEKLASMVEFIKRTEGASEAKAAEKARKWLSRQPAWRDHTSE